MASASLLFASLLSLTLVLACVLSTPLDAEASIEEDGDLQLAMSLASQALGNEKLRTRVVRHALQALAPQVHGISKRAVQALAPHARALIPAEFSLAGLTLLGTFKAAVMLLGSVFFASSFLPALFAFFGLSSPPLAFRSLTDSVNELRKLNYDVVARSLDAIQKKSYLLDIREESCKDRAICEVGEFVGDKYPSVAFWLQNLGGYDKLLLGDQYALAMVKGMKQQSCARLFPKCRQSPFSTWNEIVEKFR